MKRIFLFVLILALFAFADYPWFENVRVSTDEPWDTLNQGESCFDVFGDTIVSICNTAERGDIANAPYAYSWDEGETFSQYAFNDSVSTGIGWHTDPVIEFDDSGHVHMLIQYSSNFMNHYYSKDGGMTWCDTTRINSLWEADKPWWVVNNNEIYVVWQRGDPQAGIWFAKSTDYGATFTDKRIWNRLYVTALGMDENENLHLSLVDYTTGNFVWYRKSTDKGETWLDEVNLGNWSYDDSYGDRCPINSITATGNVVFCTWVDNSANGSWDISAARSTDGGTSFDTKFTVNDITSGGQCKGWAHFDMYGGLHVMWYHTPDWPTNPSSYFSLRYQYSPDSGATFYPSIRISDTEAPSHADFMGEYHVLRSDSEYLYAIWTDGRNPGDNDLYFSKALLSDLACKENYTHTPCENNKILSVPTIWHGKVLLEIAQHNGPLDVNVYDVMGRLVKNLYQGKITKPMHISLNSDDFPMGILFIRVTSNTTHEVRKVVNLGER
jgi:hypothetical protein